LKIGERRGGEGTSRPAKEDFLLEGLEDFKCLDGVKILGIFVGVRVIATPADSGGGRDRGIDSDGEAVA
jgi:hypothetical protein